MKSLYNEYLTGIDREAAIIVAESEAQFAKLDFLLETVNANLEVNMLQAEAKVFAENGTYDDLTMLYTEAEKEAGKAKGNILATIFGAIATFFGKIKAFFVKHFGNQEIPENVKVHPKMEEDMNLIEKCWDKLKTGVSEIKNGNIASGIGKIALVTVPTLVTVGGVAAGVTLTIVKRDKIKGWLDSLTKKSDEVQSATDAASKKVDDAENIFNNIKNFFVGNGGKDGESGESIFQKAKNLLNKFGESIKDLIATIRKFIQNTFSGKEANQEAAEPKADGQAPAEEPKKDEDRKSVV